VEVTHALKLALAELYFRESCDQQGFAYTLAAGISDFKSITFQKGRHSISVKMHEQVAAEIMKFTKTFDYVAYRAGQKDRYEPTLANPLALFWVKTRPGFTEAQLDALAKTRLQVAMFKIRDVLAPPGRIETRWEIKDAKEWLDEIDERREEAESDDDYL
jgi:hypothetical protein